MFKVGDKVVKKDGSEWDLWKYRIVRVADEYGYIMLYGDSKIYCEEELKLYKEEYNMDFKVGDKVKIINGRNFSNGERVCTIDKIDYNNNGVKRAWFKETGSCLHCEYLKKAEEDNTEKTFREVIATIKEGEVWENIKKNQRVERVRLCPTMETIVFEGDVSCSSNDILCAVNPNSKFKLQRKQYSFEEAFKEYENGKEIESIEGMKYRYKMEGRNDKYYSEINSSFYSNDSFDIKEIRGKWYIND